jgi:hypothetical protein
MGDDSPVILTEKRREVLNQEYDGSGSSERTHHSLTRQQSQTALEELVEVAESPIIHNPDVFDAETVVNLVSALLTIPDHLDPENPDDHTALMNYYQHREQLVEGLSWEMSQSNHPAQKRDEKQ